MKIHSTGTICAGSFSDRFALKRHQNIHQKYGQTAPLQPGEGDDMMGTEDEEMLKEEEEEDDSSIKDEMTLMA